MPDPPLSLATVALWRSPLLADLPGIAHAVTERGSDGVSAAPYASLNLGLHVGDAPAAVIQNRSRVAASFGLPLEAMVCAEQVHGAKVAVVSAGDAGRGMTDAADALPGIDALVTDTPGLLLTLFFADCLPVLLADPTRGVVAVAHAGWRGLVGGVIENTVAAMESAFRSRPSDIVAAVGPAIGACCFEVGPEVAERFDADLVKVGGRGRPHVDLPRAAARRLAALGLAPGNIDAGAAPCTACNTDRFFSHRREAGRTGRMAAVIARREAG